MKKKMMIMEMKNWSKTCQTTYNHLLKKKKVSLGMNSKSNRLLANNRNNKKMLMIICGSKMMMVKIKVLRNQVIKRSNKRRRKRRQRMNQKKKNLYFKTDTEWTPYLSDANQHFSCFV